MPLWLRIKTPHGREHERVNLDREPCPTILVSGLGDVCRRGWQYWLEQDDCVGLQGKPGVIPKENDPP